MARPMFVAVALSEHPPLVQFNASGASAEIAVANLRAKIERLVKERCPGFESGQEYIARNAIEIVSFELDSDQPGDVEVR